MAQAEAAPEIKEQATSFRYYLETVACFSGHPMGIEREVYVFESGQESTGRPALGVGVGSKVVWVTIPTDNPDSDSHVATLPAKVEGEWVVLEKDNVINPVPATSRGDRRFDQMRDQIPDPNPKNVEDYRKQLGGLPG